MLSQQLSLISQLADELLVLANDGQLLTGQGRTLAGHSRRASPTRGRRQAPPRLPDGTQGATMPAPLR